MAETRLDCIEDARIDDARTAAAILAVAVGVLICAHQHHFFLFWTRASFAVMLHHRCGQVISAAVVWAAAESFRTLMRHATSTLRTLPQITSSEA